MIAARAIRPGQSGLSARFYERSDTMKPDELASAGRALYGDRWQSSLAADLCVADRALRRWLEGGTPIPDGVATEVRQILIRRFKEVAALIGYSVDPSDQSVIHYSTNTFFRYDDAENLTLVHLGTANQDDLPLLVEEAKDALRREKERGKETAKRFIRASAWWLTHSSYRPVRAPRHADRVQMSTHGWAVEFGGNSKGGD
jgi:hypothetical protein